MIPILVILIIFPFAVIVIGLILGKVFGEEDDI